MTQDKKLIDFQNVVWSHYRKNSRDQLPWRFPAQNGEINPYHVLVSELMLQQTQVNRVKPKFQEFIATFPTVEVLAQASLSEVLALWSGLGYNRRAKFLHASAKKIVAEFSGVLPRVVKELIKLPGVGPNTAAAIIAYSFNEPVVFIETNIRTVFIHHFFQDQTEISDTRILPLVEATLDASDSRQWYWALMDYGSYLKATMPNPSRQSKHHITQSAFIGSRRQIRGKVLKALISEPLSLQVLNDMIKDERLVSVLGDLAAEGLISNSGSTYRLGK